MWDRTGWVRPGKLVPVVLGLGLSMVNCGGTSELRHGVADGGDSTTTGSFGGSNFGGSNFGGSNFGGDAGTGGSGGTFQTGGGGGSDFGGAPATNSVGGQTTTTTGIGGATTTTGIGGGGGTTTTTGFGGLGGSGGVAGLGGMGGTTTGFGGTTGSGGTTTTGIGGAGGIGGTGGSGGTGGTGGTGGVGGRGGTGGMEEHGESIFVLDGAAELSGSAFFDHPWPSDVRRDANGALVIDGYPNPFSLSLIDGYKTLMQGRLDGFSPVAAGYVRFTVPLAVATLPSVEGSLNSSSTVKLVDISEDSPEFGQQKRLMLSFYPSGSTYLPENTLAFAPAFGQPLRPDTRYALVVTDAVLDTNGLWLTPAPDLAQLLEGDVPAEAQMYGDAIDELEGMGIENIIQLAVFTTTDPTREAFLLRDATVEDFEAPSASSWSAEEQVAGLYDVYEGEYGPSPDYQFGTPPFETPASGGDVRYDDQGRPIVQREFSLRFALGVPDASECPEPDAGYPIVLVAHGTGGDYRSAFNTNAEATMFAQECLATLSIDQIFHGERPGAELEAADLLYFNLQNPLSARTNGPQSAVDFVQLARLVTEENLKVPANVSRTDSAINFDGDRVLFFGHSQGGLNGPIALAADEQMRGGVLSGAAATITLALLDKTQPYDFKTLLAGLLGLSSTSELDEFHPALSLAQTLADPSDGIHYARSIVQEPRQGFAAKSVFMTEGVRANGTGDSYAPPRGIEALAAAVGLPTRLPQIHASVFAAWAGISTLDVPADGVSGNLAGGAASGALAQYDADAASDGHFVAYQVDEARLDLAAFLRSLADDPSGRVPQ